MMEFTRDRLLAARAPLTFLLAAVVFTAPMPMAAQGAAPAATVPAKNKSTARPAKYQPPRLPDGRPDFSGYWTNHTATPLQRPASFQGREFVTPDEAARIERGTVRVDQAKAPPGSVGGYNAVFFESRQVVATLRTSIITDPKDGKLPPFSAEAQRRFAAEREYRDQHPADDAQHLFVWDRCLWMPNIGPPMLPYAYNNTYHIVQTHDHVAIAAEMMHDFRTIPLDGRPHGSIPQWAGDSVGHYEGDTLVVETTNLNGRAGADDGTANPSVNWAGRSMFLIFHRTSDRTRVIERFTRTAPDILLYQFTIEDPSIYTAPWSGEITMRWSKDPVYEYACHEGNYALVNILGGVRAEEKAAAASR